MGDASEIHAPSSSAHRANIAASRAILPSDAVCRRAPTSPALPTSDARRVSARLTPATRLNAPTPSAALMVNAEATALELFAGKV